MGWAVNLLDSLVWYWDLDSADATITDQHSGLTLSRIGTTTTVTGGAPDGGNCISVGTSAGKYRNASVAKTVNYDDGYTVNIWGYSTSRSLRFNILIMHRIDTGEPMYFQLQSQDSFAASPAIVDSAVTWQSAASGLRLANANPAGSQNAWHMLTLRDTGTATEIYRDGVFIASSNTNITTRDTAAATFSIGGDWTTGASTIFSHRGRVSMAGVWDRPLSAAEILQLYNFGAGLRYSALALAGARPLINGGLINNSLINRSLIR